MNNELPLKQIIDAALSRIGSVADVNTVVGEPLAVGDGVTIIPFSKVSVGFASGGSDFTTKNQKPEADNSFGGGSGAGINIIPVAFLIVKGDSVKLLPVAQPAGSTVDRVVEMVPEVIDKVTGFIEKQQQEKKENQDF